MPRMNLPMQMTVKLLYKQSIAPTTTRTLFARIMLYLPRCMRPGASMQATIAPRLVHVVTIFPPHTSKVEPGSHPLKYPKTPSRVLNVEIVYPNWNMPIVIVRTWNKTNGLIETIKLK